MYSGSHIFLLHIHLYLHQLSHCCIFCNSSWSVPLSDVSLSLFSIFFRFCHPGTWLHFPYLDMSNNLRGKSVIASYRTFLHCGVLSCKVSCEKNSLHCEVCSKWFHYKCIKILERDYIDIKSKNLTFVCGIECYNAILPFFSLEQIDFLNTLVDYGSCPYPCKTCKKACIGNQLICIQCYICDK